MNRSKSEESDNARTMHTDSLKSTARSSKPKGADMRGIQKIKNKDGTYSYRAQVRLKDGLPPQSKSFPSQICQYKARYENGQQESLTSWLGSIKSLGLSSDICVSSCFLIWIHGNTWRFVEH